MAVQRGNSASVLDTMDLSASTECGDMPRPGPYDAPDYSPPPLPDTSEDEDEESSPKSLPVKVNVNVAQPLSPLHPSQSQLHPQDGPAATSKNW